MAALERIFLLYCFVFSFANLVRVIGSSAWREERITNPSEMEMFVDELPDMPRIKGFDVVDGVPKSKLLKIGMYRKKWVCAVSSFSCFVYSFPQCFLRYILGSRFVHELAS